MGFDLFVLALHGDFCYLGCRVLFLLDLLLNQPRLLRLHHVLRIEVTLERAVSDLRDWGELRVSRSAFSLELFHLLVVCLLVPLGHWGLEVTHLLGTLDQVPLRLSRLSAARDVVEVAVHLVVVNGSVVGVVRGERGHWLQSLGIERGAQCDSLRGGGHPWHYRHLNSVLALHDVALCGCLSKRLFVQPLTLVQWEGLLRCRSHRGLITAVLIAGRARLHVGLLDLVLLRERVSNLLQVCLEQWIVAMPGEVAHGLGVRRLLESSLILAGSLLVVMLARLPGLRVRACIGVGLLALLEWGLILDGLSRYDR